MPETAGSVLVCLTAWLPDGCLNFKTNMASTLAKMSFRIFAQLHRSYLEALSLSIRRDHCIGPLKGYDEHNEDSPTRATDGFPAGNRVQYLRDDTRPGTMIRARNYHIVNQK